MKKTNRTKISTRIIERGTSIYMYIFSFSPGDFSAVENMMNERTRKKLALDILYSTINSIHVNVYSHKENI
jgi:hypothetical protein